MLLKGMLWPKRRYTAVKNWPLCRTQNVAHSSAANTFDNWDKCHALDLLRTLCCIGNTTKQLMSVCYEIHLPRMTMVIQCAHF